MFSRSGGNVCRYSYSARQGCFSPGLPKITPSSCDLNNSTHWKVRNAQVIACPDRQKWCPLRLTIFVFTHLVPVIYWHPTPGTCIISSLKMFLLFFLGSWAKGVYYNFLVLGLPIDQMHENIAHILLQRFKSLNFSCMKRNFFTSSVSSSLRLPLGALLPVM